jgi:hypothetical protein
MITNSVNGGDGFVSFSLTEFRITVVRVVERGFGLSGNAEWQNLRRIGPLGLVLIAGAWVVGSLYRFEKDLRSEPRGW